jgi:hypothetical protein
VRPRVLPRVAEKEPVLGVVDITYSLDQANEHLTTHVVRMALVSLGFVLLVSVSVGWLLRRLIYRPLRDLARGSERIASGDFDQAIPVRRRGRIRPARAVHQHHDGGAEEIAPGTGGLGRHAGREGQGTYRGTAAGRGRGSPAARSWRPSASSPPASRTN